MPSRALVYDAGVLRGVRPMGLWSTTTTRCGPAFRAFLRASSSGASTPITKLDFPLPLTPVTAVRQRRGIRVLNPLRLLMSAFSTSIHSLGVRRSSGSGMVRSPLRNSPVGLLALAISCQVPDATISPPNSPAAGPMSMTWSAVLITSGSCSTTTSVFPRSRRPVSVPRRRWVSR